MATRGESNTKQQFWENTHEKHPRFSLHAQDTVVPRPYTYTYYSILNREGGGDQTYSEKGHRTARARPSLELLQDRLDFEHTRDGEAWRWLPRWRRA